MLRPLQLNRRCAARTRDSHLRVPLPSLFFSELSALRRAAAKQRGGLDLVERAMGGDVAPRLGDPGARAHRTGQAHGLGQRLIDVARRQSLQRAMVARVGARRGTVGAVDLDQRAELALEIGPPAVLRPAAAEVGPERLIFGDQVVEPDRLMRRGDDRRHRALMSAHRSGRPAESRDSRARPRDRSPGARRRRRPGRRRARRSLRPAASHSRPGPGALRAARPARRGSDRAVEPQSAARRSHRRSVAAPAADGCVGRNPEEVRGRLIARQSPGRSAAAPTRISTRPISSRALQLMPVR